MDRHLNNKFSPTLLAETQFRSEDRRKLPETSQNPLERNRLLAERFRERARKIKAPFSILLYGSTAYGFEKPSRDIDMILVLDKGISVADFLEKAKYVFESELDISMNILTGLLQGDWNTCRMYGISQNISLDIRLMTRETFTYLATDNGLVKPIFDVSDARQKILYGKEWSFREWKRIPVRPEHQEITDNDGNKLLIIKDHFFTEKGTRLGGFGSRLLQAVPLYDPSGHVKNKDQEVLVSLWIAFVHSCLKEHPNLTTDQIIGALIRSERFSPKYRAYLSEIIEEVRQDLSVGD